MSPVDRTMRDAADRLDAQASQIKQLEYAVDFVLNDAHSRGYLSTNDALDAIAPPVEALVEALEEVIAGCSQAST